MYIYIYKYFYLGDKPINPIVGVYIPITRMSIPKGVTSLSPLVGSGMTGRHIYKSKWEKGPRAERDHGTGETSPQVRSFTWSIWPRCRGESNNSRQVLPSDLFGCFKWPPFGWSLWKKLGPMCFRFFPFGKKLKLTWMISFWGGFAFLVVFLGSSNRYFVRKCYVCTWLYICLFFKITYIQ